MYNLALGRTLSLLRSYSMIFIDEVWSWTPFIVWKEVLVVNQLHRGTHWRLS